MKPRTSAHKSFTDRANYFSHPLAKQLLQLMDQKKTNLALSADVTTQEQLLSLVNLLGPEICLLKTHIDIISNFDARLLTLLRALAEQHQFIILEDRKFADIGSIVEHQYQDSIYRIADWAETVTVHSVAGPGVVQGLKKIGHSKNRGCFLIAEMSSEGHLLDEHYCNTTLNIAKENQDFVIGFISQRRLTDSPDFIYLTPGIHLSSKKDAIDQRYSNPHQAVFERGSDIVIVGRNIYLAENPLSVARHLREVAWQAYTSRIQL